MFACVTPNGDLDLTLRLTGRTEEVEFDVELLAVR